jgi:hypothetical protein
MSLYHRPKSRPSRPYHVVVYVHGVRREAWYLIEDEAKKAEKYWLSQNTCCVVEANGEPCGHQIKTNNMCNRHYLRFKRHGDPLYRRHKGRGAVSEAESVPAPCGARIVGTEAPRRCKLHLDCPVSQYDKCLSWSIKANFKGWVNV